jgi:pimeloyl-ACP methyl ester carboxylesterase
VQGSSRRLLREAPPIPSSWDDLLEGIETPAQWEERRQTRKARFLELIRDAAKPTRVSPDLAVHDEIIVDGSYRLQRLSYQVEVDERAFAYVGIPLSASSPVPGVVALHGTRPHGAREIAGLEGVRDRAFLDHLCRRGFAVIAPEHFVAGERTPPEGAYHTKRFYEKHPTWTAVGKFTFEHSIATDLLATLPEVDESRLGVIGHSLGGQGAAFLAAYDERFKAAAVNCSAASFRHNPDFLNWARDQWYVYFGHLRESLLRGEAPPIDFHEILALIAPRALLEIFAWNDEQGHAATQRMRTLMHLKLAELYDLLGAPRNSAFYVHGHGHAVPEDSRALLYGFLERHLK